MWFFIKIKSQTQTDRGNKFISILSHVQKVESIYSLQTTDQVNEADDLLHRMKAYSSVLLMLLTIKNIQRGRLPDLTFPLRDSVSNRSPNLRKHFISKT